MGKQAKILKVSFLRPAAFLTFFNLAREKKSLATPDTLPVKQKTHISAVSF